MLLCLSRQTHLRLSMVSAMRFTFTLVSRIPEEVLQKTSAKCCSRDLLKVSFAPGVYKFPKTDSETASPKTYKTYGGSGKD